MTLLDIRLFGHIAVSFGGDAVKLPTRKAAQSLFAYLLLHRGVAVSRDVLAFTLWPDDEEDVARGNLRRVLHLLIEALPRGERWILTDNETLQWNPAAPYRLDVAEFERLSADDAHVADAVELYREDLLAPIYDDWAIVAREHYRGRYLLALTQLVRIERSRRDFERALLYCERLLTADPWREDALRQLIALRMERGDRAGAIASYEGFHARLRAELGVEPMPETTALYEAIVRGDVTSAPAAATWPAAGAMRFHSPFVGRTAERAALLEAWHAATQRHGSVAIVAGEAGIGKTRLVHELVLAVEAEGGRVVAGTTSSPEAVPYQAFVEALRAATPMIAAARVAPQWFAAAAELVPEVRARIPDLPHLPAVDAQNERARLFEALTHVVLGLASRPLLVVLEDLHWAGEATVEALTYVARRCADKPVLIVTTYREDELTQAHALRSARRTLQAHEATTVVAPRPLERRDVDALLEAAGTERAGALGAEVLLERSRGNPLFLEMLLREGAAPDAAGGIAALVAGRLERLPSTARAVVETAALVGDTFEVEVVREAGGWAESAMLDALDELIERRFVAELGRRDGLSYAFRHNVIRTAIEDGIAPPLRAARHHRIGRVLERAFPERADALAATIARHYEAAGDAARAPVFYLRAARAAHAVFAADEAVALASRGLELRPDAATRRDLLLLRETVHGQRGSRDAQRADIDALDALARETRDAELACDALHRRAMLAEATVDREAGERATAALRARAGAAGLEHWTAAAQKVEASLALLSDRYEDACRLATDALARYRTLGDERGAVEARLVCADGLAYLGRYDEAAATAAEAEAAAEALADPYLVIRVLLTAQRVPIFRQDFAAVDRSAQRMLAVARSIGDRVREAHALNMAGTAAIRLYRIREAFANVEAAVAAFYDIGNEKAARIADGNLAAFQISLGRADLARPRLERERDITAGTTDVQRTYFAESNLGVADFYLGDFARAAQEHERAVTLARTLKSPALEALALGDLGMTLAALGRPADGYPHLRDAVALHRRMEQRFTLMHNLSRFAFVAAQIVRFDEARDAAREVDAAYAATPERFEEPAEILWNAAQGYALAAEPARYAALVEAAAHALRARIASIDLPEYRAAYAAIRWHVEVLAAADALAHMRGESQSSSSDATAENTAASTLAPAKTANAARGASAPKARGAAASAPASGSSK